MDPECTETGGRSLKPEDTRNPWRVGGLRRVFLALLHSLEGLGAAFKHEAAFRQECVAALVLVPVALLLDIPLYARLVLIGVVVFVLIVELLNTAVENCIDYISFERHPFAKRAKDLGSAAVFLSMVFAILAWVLVLINYWPPQF